MFRSSAYTNLCSLPYFATLFQALHFFLSISLSSLTSDSPTPLDDSTAAFALFAISSLVFALLSGISYCNHPLNAGHSPKLSPTDALVECGHIAFQYKNSCDSASNQVYSIPCDEVKNLVIEFDNQQPISVLIIHDAWEARVQVFFASFDLEVLDSIGR